MKMRNWQGKSVSHESFKCTVKQARGEKEKKDQSQSKTDARGMQEQGPVWR